MSIGTIREVAGELVGEREVVRLTRSIRSFVAVQSIVDRKKSFVGIGVDARARGRLTQRDRIRGRGVHAGRISVPLRERTARGHPAIEVVAAVDRLSLRIEHWLHHASSKAGDITLEVRMWRQPELLT